MGLLLGVVAGPAPGSACADRVLHLWGAPPPQELHPARQLELVSTARAGMWGYLPARRSTRFCHLCNSSLVEAARSACLCALPACMPGFPSRLKGMHCWLFLSATLPLPAGMARPWCGPGTTRPASGTAAWRCPAAWQQRRYRLRQRQQPATTRPRHPRLSGRPGPQAALPPSQLLSAGPSSPPLQGQAQA